MTAKDAGVAEEPTRMNTGNATPAKVTAWGTAPVTIMSRATLTVWGTALVASVMRVSAREIDMAVAAIVTSKQSNIAAALAQMIIAGIEV